jgi:hypothetical protein
MIGIKSATFSTNSKDSYSLFAMIFLPSPIVVALETMTTINYAIAKTNIASKRLQGLHDGSQ